MPPKLDASPPLGATARPRHVGSPAPVGWRPQSLWPTVRWLGSGPGQKPPTFFRFEQQKKNSASIGNS